MFSTNFLNVHKYLVFHESGLCLLIDKIFDIFSKIFQVGMAQCFFSLLFDPYVIIIQVAVMWVS